MDQFLLEESVLLYQLVILDFKLLDFLLEPNLSTVVEFFDLNGLLVQAMELIQFLIR